MHATSLPAACLALPFFVLEPNDRFPHALETKHTPTHTHTHFSLLRSLGNLPGVVVSEAISPITLAPLLADRHCGKGTKLVFYMNPGELLSRKFTSKDTHSTAGDLLVVYAEVRYAWCSVLAAGLDAWWLFFLVSLEICIEVCTTTTPVWKEGIAIDRRCRET